MERSAAQTILLQEFPRELIKQTAKGADYVEASDIIWRLINAWGDGWSFLVHEAQVHDPFVMVRASLVSPTGARWDAIGGGQVHSISKADTRPNYEFAFKSACTDALKVAARLAGVALHLYGPDREGGVMPQDEGAAQYREPTPDIRQRQPPPQQQAPPQRQPPQQQHPPPRNPDAGPPCLDVEIRFGKHKGKTWGELIKTMDGLGYIAWASSKEGPDKDAAAIASWLSKHPEWRPETFDAGPQQQTQFVSQAPIDEDAPWRTGH